MMYNPSINRLGVVNGVARIGMLWILLLSTDAQWLACCFVPPQHHARIQPRKSVSCFHANMVPFRKNSDTSVPVKQSSASISNNRAPSNQDSKQEQNSNTKRDEHSLAFQLEEMKQRADKGEILTQSYCDSVLALCVACNEWDSVLDVLEVMKQYGLQQEHSTYRAALETCVEFANGPSAAELLETMKQAGQTPDSTDVALAVEAMCTCDTMWNRAMTLLMKTAHEKENDNVVPVKAYDAVLSSIPSEHWKSAVQLLHSMQQEESHPNPTMSSVRAVIETCVAAQQAEQAYTILTSMSSEGFKPTPFMFELVVSALAKRSSWRRALQLLHVMDDLHIQKTVVTYNTVISACARAGEVGTAKNVLAKMKQSGVKPNIISFNSLMAACASTSRWKDALSILDQCHREPGVQPDIITYTNAMRACAKGRQTNRALALLQVVKDMKLPIDAYCYTAVIDACAKGKRWKTALELLEEMEANGIMPNAITYSVAINACGNGGQAKEALALLDQMKEKKMRINLITYNSAITALSKASKMNAKFPGQSNDSRQAASVTFPKSEVVNVDNEQLWVQALELIEQIKAEGMKPDGFSYSAAISCCGSGGRWKEALEIIETMQKGGPKMRPNKIAYTAAISACGRSGKYKEALQLFIVMKNQGLHPDRIAYNAVFSALRVANRPEEAYQLWNEICGKCNAKPTASSTATPLAVSPDIITVSDVIGTLSRAETIDKDKVDEVFEEAVKRGIVLREESLDSDYEVDLTGMTLPVARAACRYIFNRILANYRKGEKPSEVTLLTGVGRAQQQQQQDGMGDGEKKLTALREYILQDLEEDFDPPMHGIVPQRAQGTVAIAQNQVEAWIAGQ